MLQSSRYADGAVLPQPPWLAVGLVSQHYNIELAPRAGFNHFAAGKRDTLSLCCGSAEGPLQDADRFVRMDQNVSGRTVLRVREHKDAQIDLFLIRFESARFCTLDL